MEDGRLPSRRQAFVPPHDFWDRTPASAGSSISPSFSKPPIEFRCPISKGIMTDPLISLSTGISYEKTAINAWQSLRGNVCPVSGNAMGLLVPNTELKEEIAEWKQQIKGLRRIQRGSPTTYCVADNMFAPTRSHSDPSTKGEDEKDHRSEERKQDMHKQIEHVLDTFIEAGIRDYVDHDHTNSEIRGRRSATNNEAERPAEAAPTYSYDLEYSSIFRLGPTMNTNSTR